MVKNKLSNQDLAKLAHKSQVYFATFCAERVVHLITNEYRILCQINIDLAKKWCIGEATFEECNTAFRAFNKFATQSDLAVDRAAKASSNLLYNIIFPEHANYGSSGNVAIDIALSNDIQATIDAQWTYYEGLLDLDERIETMLLTGDPDDYKTKRD